MPVKNDSLRFDEKVLCLYFFTGIILLELRFKLLGAIDHQHLMIRGRNLCRVFLHKGTCSKIRNFSYRK